MKLGVGSVMAWAQRRWSLGPRCAFWGGELVNPSQRRPLCRSFLFLAPALAGYSCEELTSDKAEKSSLPLRVHRDFLCSCGGCGRRWLLWPPIDKRRHHDLPTRCGLFVGLYVQGQGRSGWLLQTERSELWATPGRSNANRWYTLNHGQRDGSGW